MWVWVWVRAHMCVCVFPPLCVYVHKKKRREKKERSLAREEWGPVQVSPRGLLCPLVSRCVCACVRTC